MRTIKASEFKAKCLALMDEVAATRRPVLITKNGRPVAELVPYTAKSGDRLIGLHKGEVEILGDIMSPIDVEWDALK